MTASLTSRERLLRAINRAEVDHVPCAFMSFSAMRGRCQDAYDVCLKELSMGLDSYLFVPPTWRNQRPNHPDLRGLPVRLPPDVDMHLWLEEREGESYPILHKEYRTPIGTLTTEVRKATDWPHGNFVPFFDDFQVPRMIKPLVTSAADLEVLRYMLVAPSPRDIAEMRGVVAEARDFSAQHGVLIAGGWGVGADMAAWLCGLQDLMLLAVDNPGLLSELLALIAEWNEQRMRVVLESGVDLFIRRGWYESAQFWSPKLYRSFLLPILQREVSLAHEYGTPFGYIMTTGLLPMLDNIADSRIDVLLGLDPLQGPGDPLAAAKQALGGRVCLWGGVSGAITVEGGREEDVRQDVQRAMSSMQGTNGFILSPVDNITEITQRAWRNVDVFVQAWKEAR